MGLIVRNAVKKSTRVAWFEFMDGAEFQLRYINPDEREKLINAATEKIFDPKKGMNVEKLNTATLAAKIREYDVIKDWRLKGAVLPQIVDLTEYPDPQADLPFDVEDCEHLIRYAEGLGGWLLDTMRTLSAFAAAEAAKRKNASSPSPADSSGSLAAVGES